MDSNKVHPGMEQTLRHRPLAGAARFRAVGFTAMAGLPSQMAHQSAHGTHLARRRINREKEKRRRQLDNSKNLHAQKRGALSIETITEAEKRGLKLSQDDDFDEVERLKQIEIIKQMPISIAVKRKMRDGLMKGIADDLSGDCCSLHLYQQRVRCYRCKMKCMLDWQDFRSVTTLFRGSFKRIDGHFGSGVLTYFVFLKWIFQINLVLAFVNIFFLMVPARIFGNVDYTSSSTAENLTYVQNVSLTCSALYQDNLALVNHTAIDYILDFLQGTGMLEETLVFYGSYSNEEMDISFTNFNYNMPLAFMCVIIFTFLFSLIGLIKNTAKGFRERMFTSHGSNRQYCNRVFSGWDWGMTDEKNCILRQKSIFRDIMGNIEEQVRAFERANYSNKEKCKVYSIRVLINILILCLLGGSGYLIYFVTFKQIELTSDPAFLTYERWLKFLIEYLTSLTITILNGLMPIIFKKLVTWEDLTPAMEVNLTLVRTVFLRLASLAVLIFTIYTKISCGPKNECGVGTGEDCSQVLCWETYVGQEFYKLMMTDLIIVVGIIFLVEFPRRLIVTKCSCKLAKMIGQQQFDIPKNVLDLIYGETLIWLGCMFSPAIPVIGMFKSLIIFGLKELTLLWNYIPNNRPFKATDSQVFFLVVLGCSYTVSTLPIYYVIWRMTPSRACGPFRTYDKMYDILPLTINQWPAWLRNTINIITSAIILIPAFVVLALTIYYLKSLVNAYQEMVQTLKEQLSMEGQDKQFLLKRIQELTGVSKDKDKPKAIPENPPAYSNINEREKKNLGSPINVPVVDIE